MARILVAEDEAPLRGHIVRALAAGGHDAVATADGGEALDALARDALERDGGRFDLLLTDIKMPVMDGIALALAVARDYPDLAIVLMTGHADQRQRASGLDALIERVLEKPFSLAELNCAVGEVLGIMR